MITFKHVKIETSPSKRGGRRVGMGVTAYVKWRDIRYQYGAGEELIGNCELTLEPRGIALFTPEQATEVAAYLREVNPGAKVTIF